jgi:phosphoglycerol transferase MdoB-like AlkP superfamily enzyme
MMMRARGADLQDDSEPASEESRTRRSGGRLLILGIRTGLITLGWAALVNFGLDLSMWTARPRQLIHGPLHTTAWALNVLVVWVVVLLVLAVAGRVWLTLQITGTLTVLIGMVNAAKLSLRDAPVRPSDLAYLSQPGFLTEMVGGGQVIAIAVAVLLVGFAMTSVIGRLLGHWLPRLRTGTGIRTARLRWGSRLVVFALCLTILADAGSFNKDGNWWRAAYDSVGTRWRTWDQRANFMGNGFVAGTLFNMPIKAMAKPSGYSAAKMAEISARYEAAARDINQGRDGSLADTNIVVALSESFTNPSWLETVTWERNLVPHTEEVMANTVSGRMLSPGYGGGTANIEFELLTGQSMSQFNPQLDSLYEQVVSKQSNYPSMVQWFSERGHYPIALHPYSFRMYQRPTVFDLFGFQDLIDSAEMRENFRVGGGRYVSDAAAFRTVEGEIADRDEPVFLHLISMQNHMPYRDQYDDPILPSEGLPEKKAALAGQYARGLTMTDDALADFLAGQKSSPEKTVVIFYGDHLPPQIYPNNLRRREGKRVAHETPFLIWSNREPLAHTELPTTSPIYFLPKLFAATDTPIPSYFALLEALNQQIPAMDAGIYVDGSDQSIKKRDLSSEQKQVLEDYRYVVYDLSVGERYSQRVLFADPPGKVVGVRSSRPAIPHSGLPGVF